MSRVVRGLDGCPTGWVVVELQDGRISHIEVVAGLGEALDSQPLAAAGIDMPLGLLDVTARDADIAARKLLPGRGSSVFNAPPRAVVDAWLSRELSDHRSATELAVQVTGKGISQQAWRLVPKVAALDAWMATAPIPILEVHPEVAFATVVGAPLPRKRSWAGLMSRRTLLADLGIVLPDRFPGDQDCAPDDVVDAAICAWVADGVALGTPPVTVPDPVTQHDGSRPIVIHARRAP